MAKAKNRNRRARLSINAFKGMVVRFFTKHWVTANIHVIGDAMACWHTFKEYDFALDLTLWQIKRKISAEGLKSAGWAFLADDPFVRQLLGIDAGAIKNIIGGG